mgnify:FL=1
MDLFNCVFRYYMTKHGTSSVFNPFNDLDKCVSLTVIYAKPAKEIFDRIYN